MSRPSKADEDRLEALEGMAALLSAAMDATGILAVRLRQVLRRAPELAAVIEPAGNELVRIVDSCDDARRLLNRLLEGEQAQRTASNAGAGSGGSGVWNGHDGEERAEE